MYTIFPACKVGTPSVYSNNTFPHCADLTGRTILDTPNPGLTTRADMLRPFRACVAANIQKWAHCDVGYTVIELAGPPIYEIWTRFDVCYTVIGLSCPPTNTKNAKARRLSIGRLAGFEGIMCLCAGQRRGKDMPIVTLALRLLSGMNSLDTLPKMRSEPMKKL